MWGEHPMAVGNWLIHSSHVMNPGPFSSLSTGQSPRPPFNQRLAAPVLKYLEARGLLIEIEVREAMQQIVTILVGLAVAAIALFGAWLLLTVSLVGTLSYYLGGSWTKATAIVGAIYLFVAFTTAFMTMNRIRTARWFADSLNELKKDRTWIKSQTTAN